MTDATRAYPFTFSEADLEDQRDRFRRARWPDRETVDDWSQGAPLSVLRAVCDYWLTGHNWRACEARLNALDPSMTRINGLDMHFLHDRSPEPDAVPPGADPLTARLRAEFTRAAPLLADPSKHGGNAQDAIHFGSS